MSVALETIAKLRQKDHHKVAKTDVELILNTSTRKERWVQWDVRKIDNVKTYYEVYNPDPNQEILWVEFHAQARVFPPLASIAKLRRFEGPDTHGHFMCGVELDVAKLDADQAVKKVQRQLDIVYNVVEAELKKNGSKITHIIKKARNERRSESRGVRRRSNDTKVPYAKVDGMPWYVGWRCDESCLDKSYDKKFGNLKKTAGLTWLPWVGKEYRNERILVIGESNYTDKGWTKTVDEDQRYTRKVVDHICFRRMHRQSQTLPNIARMLNVFEGTKMDIVPMVWSRIAFVDVCQRCLEQVDKRRKRPTDADIVDGWRTIFALIKILKPRFLIFMGKTAADFLSDEVKGMQVSCPITCSRKSDSRHKHAIIETGDMKIPMILLPHPSNGFSHNVWRKYLRETFPSDPYFRRLVD